MDYLRSLSCLKIVLPALVVFLVQTGCDKKKCSTDDDCPKGSACFQGECLSIEGRGSIHTPSRRKQPNPTDVYRLDVDPSINPMMGAADALVTIVEISEFQCPYCKRGAETIKEIVDKYPKDVRLFFMHSPLGKRKPAMDAAQAAQAVFHIAGNETFWKFHDLVFENQRSGLAMAALEAFARKLDVDMKRFKKAMESGAHEKEVLEQVALAQKLGITGVPAFFINGRFLGGAQPAPNIEKLVKEELEKARKLVEEKKIPREKVYEHIMKNAKTAP